MNVYIETNFILEHSYLQEQHEWCERILMLAEADRVRLVTPSFSVGEAYSALVGRNKRRRRLYEDLIQELKELSRSQPYASIREEFLEITRLLSTSGEEDKARLDGALLRLVQVSTLIGIDSNVIVSAMQLQRTRGLTPPDSLVYAAILSDLGSYQDNQPSCFVTKNAKDFSNPDIETDLSQLGCRLFTGFGEAFGFLSNLE